MNFIWGLCKVHWKLNGRHVIPLLTRMHSSRMRTIRCSGHLGVSQHGLGRGVYPSMDWAVGVCVSQHALGRGCLPGGVSAQVRGCLPHTPWQTPPTCEQNHRCLWKHNLAATTLRTVNIWKYTIFYTNWVLIDDKLYCQVYSHIYILKIDEIV